MENQHQCFETLIDRDLPTLRRAAWQITGNADDADDAVQNALISAWKSFASFRSEAKLSSWLYRITVNAACDLMRKRRTEEKKRRDFTDAGAAGTEPVNPQLEALRRAIAQLPEKYREAVAVGSLSGMPGEKAAAVLGCSVNALYQRLSRAKAMLKEIMEKEVNE